MTAFPRRRLLALTLGLLAAVHLPGQAQPAWKPDRPVTIVVPYSAGGGNDVQTRAVAQELSRIWGQPVVVENTPGADGLIGTRKVAAAKPDGYTLLEQIPSLTLIRHTAGARGYDPLALLQPVSAFSLLPAAFAVHPSVPAKTLAEATKLCKATPKLCSFGVAENAARLQARMLQAEAGLEDAMVLVNYKGASPLVTDMVAGNVNMGITGVTAFLPYYRSGALRVLAVLAHKRISAMPDVPTAAEAGYRSLDASTWYGLFAPKGTPPQVVESIAAAVAQAVKGEAATRTFASLGAEAVGNKPAEFAAMVQAENQRMDAAARRFPLE
jgi:tripartite-type tricarboxylate transporter receptor subunit TctC